MWIALLAAVAAPVDAPLELSVYEDCEWAVWDAYCPVLVPTDTVLFCCETALKHPGQLRLRECVDSAVVTTCPFLATTAPKGAGPASWCCNFARERLEHRGGDDFVALDGS